MVLVEQGVDLAQTHFKGWQLFAPGRINLFEVEHPLANFVLECSKRARFVVKSEFGPPGHKVEHDLQLVETIFRMSRNIKWPQFECLSGGEVYEVPVGDGEGVPKDKSLKKIELKDQGNNMKQFVQGVLGGQAGRWSEMKGDSDFFVILVVAATEPGSFFILTERLFTPYILFFHYIYHSHSFILQKSLSLVHRPMSALRPVQLVLCVHYILHQPLYVILLALFLHAVQHRVHLALLHHLVYPVFILHPHIHQVPFGASPVQQKALVRMTLIHPQRHSVQVVLL